MGNRDDKRKGIPLLVKAVAVIVISLLLVPLVIFTALPNMFFGYGSSETEAITHMTEQAMTIGGVYTSLRSLEENYMNYKGRLLREEEHPNEQ